MDKIEVKLREETLFWQNLRDKYKPDLSEAEYLRLQDAINYTEHKLQQYLIGRQKPWE